MAIANASTTTSSPYAVGQLWRCRGRRAAETPLLLINQIDTHPQGGQILDVTISDIQVRHAGMPNGTLDMLPHIPVIAQTLERSAAEHVGDSAPNQAYLPGYAEWKAAFDAGRAGSFGIAVAEILDMKASWPGAASIEQLSGGHGQTGKTAAHARQCRRRVMAACVRQCAHSRRNGQDSVPKR